MGAAAGVRPERRGRRLGGGPTKRKPSRKAAAPAADGAAAKTYSAFDPSTWGPPKEAPKSRSRKQPADKGAKAAPMPAPAADDEADNEAGGAAGKARKRKGKDPRAEPEECCVRLLRNSSRDGHMTVETLGQAVADAMGGAPWNKKWKPLVGSSRVAGSSRALAVADVNGECRVYLAAVHAELARAQKKRDKAAATAPRRRAAAAARRAREGVRFVGTALRLAGDALLAASLRGGACALDLPVLDCARPCLNGTAAGVGSGECVATGRTAKPLVRAAVGAGAARGRDDAAPVGRARHRRRAGEPLTPLAEALAAAAADGHACEPPSRRCSASRGRDRARPAAHVRAAAVSPPNTARAAPPLTRAPTSAVAARGARRGGPPPSSRSRTARCAASALDSEGRRARAVRARARLARPLGIRRGLKTQGVRGRFALRSTAPAPPAEPRLGPVCCSPPGTPTRRRT